MKPTVATALLDDDWFTNFSGQHLFHELKMFWWLHKKIHAEGKTPPEDDYMRDALVEAFVLHLRNLIDFFYPRPSAKPTDVIATNFMDNPGDWDIPTSISAALQSARDRADKELNHLTQQRKDEGDPTKTWDVHAVFTEIKGVAEKFVGKASRNKLHVTVRELVNAPAHLIVEVLAAHSHASNVIAQVISR
jgi:hypothetical protein